MDRCVIEKYFQILDLAAADPAYMDLCSYYRTLDARVVDWVSRLSGPEGDLLLEYMGTLADLEFCLLEIACKHMDFIRE